MRNSLAFDLLRKDEDVDRQADRQTEKEREEGEVSLPCLQI